MDDSRKEIIEKLKLYKQQKLSFYQATQKLLAEGYTQLQIDDAEDALGYNSTSIISKNTDSEQTSSSNKKANIFTQNYSSHGELWYPGHSGIAILLLFAAIIILAILFITGVI